MLQALNSRSCARYRLDNNGSRVPACGRPQDDEALESRAFIGSTCFPLRFSRPSRTISASPESRARAPSPDQAQLSSWTRRSRDPGSIVDLADHQYLRGRVKSKMELLTPSWRSPSGPSAAPMFAFGNPASASGFRPAAGPRMTRLSNHARLSGQHAFLCAFHVLRGPFPRVPSPESRVPSPAPRPSSVVILDAAKPRSGIHCRSSGPPILAR